MPTQMDRLNAETYRLLSHCSLRKNISIAIVCEIKEKKKTRAPASVYNYKEYHGAETHIADSKLSHKGAKVQAVFVIDGLRMIDGLCL